MPVESVQKAIDLLEQGRAEQAVPLLEDVVQSLPAYAGAFVLLARAYEAGERWPKARRSWQSALLLVPDSPVATEGIRRSLRQGRSPGKPAATDSITFSQVANLHRSIELPEPPPNEPAQDNIQHDFNDPDQLDRLIEQLEDARIMPRPDMDDGPAPDLEDDIDDMVSETLARIYTAQEQYEEAARVYDQLALQNPEQHDYFIRKAREVRDKEHGSDDEPV